MKEDRLENAYQSGEYWEKNADLHEDDSDFKYANFLTLLERNQIDISGIADIGCGAGRIIWNFSNKFITKCIGVDFDHNIINNARKKYGRDNLTYLTDFDKVYKDKECNLVILADVLEHVEDYIGFLKNIHQNFDFQLFNIPLDISIKSLLFNGPMKTRKAINHLHYFYDKLALQILMDNGYTVIDYLYADNIYFYLRQKSGPIKIIYYLYYGIIKSFEFLLGKSTTSKVFGCYSLTVLTSTRLSSSNKL